MTSWAETPSCTIRATTPATTTTTGSGPKVGLAIARMLGHITYLSRESMMQKFDANRLSPRDIATQFETKFSVGSYLAYQGDRFGERFDANSYITLSMAMDLFDLGATPEELAASLRPSTCRWLVISYTSDWLFPPFQSQQTGRRAGGQRESRSVTATWKARAATTPSCCPTNWRATER